MQVEEPLHDRFALWWVAPLIIRENEWVLDCAIKSQVLFEEALRDHIEGGVGKGHIPREEVVVEVGTPVSHYGPFQGILREAEARVEQGSLVVHVQLVGQERRVDPAIAIPAKVQRIRQQLRPVLIELLHEREVVFWGRQVIVKEVTLLARIGESYSTGIINKEHTGIGRPWVWVLYHCVALLSEEKRPDSVEESYHWGDARTAIKPDNHWICLR